MGILTSAESGSGQLLNTIKLWANWIAVLSYIGGLAWFLAIVHPGVNDRTYFSENALLPGLVDEHFTSTLGKTVTQGWKLNNNNAAPTLSEAYPAEWLAEKFQSLGLEAYVQNFSFSSPLEKKQLAGKNVYAIIRSPREASTESIVVATPFRKNSLHTISLLLNLALYLRRQIYWAKDIIFVVTDFEEVGMQAWLSGYHHRHIEGIQTKPLEARGGSIEAGVALELNGAGPYTHVELKFNMVNGQLPNLDLANLLSRMGDKEALTPTIFGRESPWDLSTPEAYFEILHTTVLGLVQQASCQSNGLHGVFGAYGIEAVTFAPYTKAERGHQQDYYVGLTEIGRIVEGTLRSINNLLEKFHQSFFFYLRPTAKRYVSIGIYMPAIGFMLLAPLLKAIALWAELYSGEGEEPSLLGLGPPITLSVFMGFVLLALPGFVAQNSGLSSAALPSLAGTSLALFAVPVFLKRNLYDVSESSSFNPQLLRSVSLISLALLIGVTSVLNFGLGFIIAVAWLPLVIPASPSNNRLRRCFSSVAVFLLNPVVTLIVVHLIKEATESPTSVKVWSGKALEGAWMWVASLIRDYHLHGSWLFPFVCLALFPLWLQFWLLATAKK